LEKGKGAPRNLMITDLKLMGKNRSLAGNTSSRVSRNRTPIHNKKSWTLVRDEIGGKTFGERLEGGGFGITMRKKAAWALPGT